MKAGRGKRGPFVVYGLFDPRNGALRYVGKSTNGAAERLKEHLSNSELRFSYRKTHWIKQLLSAGLKPEIEVLEEHVSAEALPEAERFWIAYFRMVGVNLTNLTDGGEGHDAPHSVASKRKIAASKGLRPFVDDTGRVFYTLSEAAEAHGTGASSIRKVLKGITCRAGGRAFSFDLGGPATPRPAIPHTYTPEFREALATRNRARAARMREAA